MDLKSYLRGLGLGMVVCACIIGLSNSRNKISDAEIKARAAKLGMVEQDKGVLTQLMSDGSEVTDKSGIDQEVAEEDLNIPEITIVPAEESNSDTGQEALSGDSNEADSKATSNNDTKESKNTNNLEAEEATTTDKLSGDNVSADNSNQNNNDNPQTANEGADNSKNNSDNKKDNVKENKTIVVTVYPGEGSYTVSKKLANLGLVESADVFDRFLCQNGYDKRLSTGNYTIAVGSSEEKIAKLLTGG